MDTGKRESGKRPESYGGIAGKVRLPARRMSRKDRTR